MTDNTKTKQSTILVTGGLGYIGSHLVVKLLGLGYKVIILDNNDDKTIISQLKSNFSTEVQKKLRTINMNIMDPDIKHVLDTYKVNCVFHLCALKSVPESTERPLDYYETNVSGTINLLKCMQSANVNKIIFASSAAVYGESKESLKETDNPNPNNPYGNTKVIGEQIIASYHSSDPNFKSISIRIFNPAGTLSQYKLFPPKKKQNVFPILVECMKTGKHFNIYGNEYDTSDGTAVRDYIHMEDLIDSFLLSYRYLEDNRNVRKVQEIINIGRGEGVSVKKIVNTMNWISLQNNSIGFIKTKYKPNRLGDPGTLIANIERSNNIIGFKPKKNLIDVCNSSIEFHTQKE
jgi:UDP-glucose 4-epimerase